MYRWIFGPVLCRARSWNSMILLGQHSLWFCDFFFWSISFKTSSTSTFWSLVAILQCMMLKGLLIFKADGEMDLQSWVIIVKMVCSLLYSTQQFQDRVSGPHLGACLSLGKGPRESSSAARLCCGWCGKGGTWKDHPVLAPSCWFQQHSLHAPGVTL